MRTENLTVEVESRKSDVVKNVRQDLRAGFNKILVVATDEAAMEKVERQLARAGLIVPGRVRMGSTALVRTLPRRLILSQKECHGKAKEVQRGV